MEIWKYGEKTVCVFTDVLGEHALLLEYAPSYATYQRQGVVFGWHHVLGLQQLREFNKDLAVDQKN